MSEVELNEGLLVVEDYAFAETEIAKLDLPASVRVLGDNAFESNRTQDAIRLISFNILTLNSLKALHESAVQRNRVEIAAYLMEAIGKNEKKTSMRL